MLKVNMTGGGYLDPFFGIISVTSRVRFRIFKTFTNKGGYNENLVMTDVETNTTFSIPMFNPFSARDYFILVYGTGGLPLLFHGNFTDKHITLPEQVPTFAPLVSRFPVDKVEQVDAALQGKSLDWEPLKRTLSENQIVLQVLDLNSPDKGRSKTELLLFPDGTYDRFRFKSSPTLINFDDAAAYVLKLNNVLAIACPGFALHVSKLAQQPGKGVFSVYTFANDLTLCLYSGDNCVSSIQFTAGPNKSVLEISSMTNPDAERRNYNRFLRAVALLLAPLILVDGTLVTKIRSSAVTLQSVRSLINRYEVELESPFKEYYESLQQQGVQMTEDNVGQFIKDNFAVEIDIPLTPAVMNDAQQEFAELTTGLDPRNRLRC